MAYPAQGRTIIDETKRINMALLMKMGMVDPGKKVICPLEWSENFKVGAKLGIYSLNHRLAGTGCLQLEYKCNGEDIEYKIPIVSRKSNLPQQSLIYFFECSVTKKLCRKLFFNGRVFVHQSQIDGYYECQTLSRKARDFDRLVGYMFGPNNIDEQLAKKNLKRWYNGLPTKRYKKLMIWKRRISLMTRDEIDGIIINGCL
ncbi:hypothetical protein ACFOWA_20085 [Pedobacter lithocola]|uniref:Uncharacterized protein n=1 Tax=Pedobacter lithocola TaxID=1908239 RepID=A0ABV8PDU4_9SPHI